MEGRDRQNGRADLETGEIDALGVRTRVEAALATQRLPYASPTRVHSEDTRLIGIGPLVLELAEPDRVVRRIAWRAGSRAREHLAGEHSRQVSSVELVQKHVRNAQATHGPTLRRLPANKHIVDTATELALPPGNEELVSHNQAPARFSCVLLRDTRLPGQAPKTADEGRVLDDHARYKLVRPSHSIGVDSLCGQVAGVNA
jgi:hypothetical protein